MLKPAIIGVSCDNMRQRERERPSCSGSLIYWLSYWFPWIEMTDILSPRQTTRRVSTPWPLNLRWPGWDCVCGREYLEELKVKGCVWVSSQRDNRGGMDGVSVSDSSLMMETSRRCLCQGWGGTRPQDLQKILYHSTLYIYNLCCVTFSKWGSVMADPLLFWPFPALPYPGQSSYNIYTQQLSRTRVSIGRMAG